MADTQKPINLGQAWCSQHQEHPKDCFEKHRPDVKEVQGALNADQLRNAIMRQHIRLQILNEDKPPPELKVIPGHLPMEVKDAE